MNKIKLTILFSFITFISFNLRGQLQTYYGDHLSPIDTIRVLNIFINVIYDQCITCNPVADTTSKWLPGPVNTINQSPPIYLLDYMDIEYDPNNIQGYFTKRYAEASFKKFIVLGDFMSVDIAQSLITPNNPTGLTGFDFLELINSAITLINDSGGLNTIYQHNNLNDFDNSRINKSLRFLPKNKNFNGKIDFAQFFFRNSTKTFGSLQNGGYTGIESGVTAILVNGNFVYFDGASVQGKIHGMDLGNSTAPSNDIHEMMHNLIGMSNNAHMGGGGPSNIDANLTTLVFNHGGWSLISSAGQSLVSCNGYERWRLDWRGPNNKNYPIAAGNQDSDMEKTDGNKSFYLRDFITTGDAIRIKLPYLDAGALEQFIWLENHQIHVNGKTEFPQYWNFPGGCKDVGLPGIYAYYQVGKNTLGGSSANDIITNYTDHLVPICADGNWDITTSWDSLEHGCVNYYKQPIQHYYQENPLNGYNDLQDHYFNSQFMDIISHDRCVGTILVKEKNGVISKNYEYAGDNEDPFVGSNSINMGTNPAPTNVITYHHKRKADGLVEKSTTLTDNRTTYLSGLRIDMVYEGSGTYKVDIRWDDYNIENDVMWSGNIVLNEQINLKTGKKITVDQNYTPNKHIRDPITGVFSDPTYFTCKNRSDFKMEALSEVELNNKSTLILESGSDFEIGNGAILRINEGSSLVLKTGSNMVVKGLGKIVINEGGYICIEDGANLTLLDPNSKINLNEEHKIGVNTSVYSDCSCRYNIMNYDYNGNGQINDLYSIYIQNKNITNLNEPSSGNIYIGSDVTNEEQDGPVKVKNGGQLIIDVENGIYIEDEFQVEAGGIFQVDE